MEAIFIWKKYEDKEIGIQSAKIIWSFINFKINIYGKARICTLLCYFLYLHLPWIVAKISFIGIRSTHQERSQKYMVIHRWQKYFFQPTSVNEDLRSLFYEYVRIKCTAWVRKCFILSPACVPCHAPKSLPPLHSAVVLSAGSQGDLKHKAGQSRCKQTAVLGITHTSHYLSNRPLKDPSMCWTERMARWTSSPCQRYASRRKHSISNRETGHDERHLKLL